MSDYLDPNNEELLKDFFMEAQLQIDALEQNILVLENDPGNGDAVDEIFRAAHTLKGAAATVQMMELAEFTHLLEDVLDEIRSGKVKTDTALVDTLLEGIDVTKAMLQARMNGEVYSGDITQVQDSLNNLLPGAKQKDVASKQKQAAPAKKAFPATAQEPASDEQGISEYELLEMKEAADSDAPILQVTVYFNEDHPMNTVGGIQVFAALKDLGKILKTDPEFEMLYEDNFYENVKYFIASDKDASEIRKRVFIPDVTTDIIVTDITSGSFPTRQKPQAKPRKQEVSQQELDKVAAQLKSAKTEKPEKQKETPKPSVTDNVEEPAEKTPPKDVAKKTAKEPSKQKVSSSILRVDSSRIDNLLNLVTETVIIKATFNQISSQFADDLSDFQTTQSEYRDDIRELFDSLPEYLEAIKEGKSIKEVKRELLDRYGNIFNLFDTFEGKLKNTVSKFRGTAQNLGRITGDLQEGVMRIRMVPISQIFSRFPRLVRDLSKTLKKNINLNIEGEDTELDKSVIEDLLDPLIHCVRNSIDHGIESPEERKEAGKPEEGQVYLKASNEGNMILIEISDDGKGIDVESIRKKAINRGLIHPNKKLTDIEAFNMIFEPGFSTAKNVTNISGRGVGLDVVKKQIEKLNGSVSVWSEKGIGTRMTIKLPLTLAIIQGLLVRVGKEIYAIPIASIVDSHRIKPSEIKLIDNYEVFNVRDDVVSLIRLNRLFKIPSSEQGDYKFVVIVGSGDKKMGLMVDSLIGEEDVVIKPLKDQYTNSPGIAGATILGDGTVSLIIDVSQLLDLGLRKELEKRKSREATIQ
ncbi:MAG: chemotaxis protein CheW [Spirochaetia bacterium]